MRFLRSLKNINLMNKKKLNCIRKKIMQLGWILIKVKYIQINNIKIKVLINLCMNLKINLVEILLY
jgi:hypothetical protein